MPRLPCVVQAALLLLLTASTLADFEFQNFKDVKDRQKELAFLMFNKTSALPIFLDKPFPVTPEGYIEMTTNHSQLAYAMWYSEKQYVAEGFEVTFAFNVAERKNNGGDGIAFVVQNAGLGGAAGITPVGKAGMGIGYSGIPKSFAIEFDMYLDPDNADPNNNHVSAHSRGEAGNNSDERVEANGGSLLESDPLIATDPLGATHLMMNEGDHNATIKYIVEDNIYLTRVEVYLDMQPDPILTVRVSLNTKLQLDSGYAYVGITSSTGDSYQIHNLHYFTFVGEPTVVRLSPFAGPMSGNTTVVGHGSNLKNYPHLQCKFGQGATPGTFISSKRVKCITPPHTRAEWVQFRLSAVKKDTWLRANPKVQYFYYPPPNITRTKPLGGPTTGGTFVRVEGMGFIPWLINETKCRFGYNYTMNALAVPNNNTVLCNYTHDKDGREIPVGMYPFDVAINGVQYTGDAHDFFVYTPMTMQRFIPQGDFVAGGDTVTITGNFTYTPELSCRFGHANDSSTLAIIDKPMYTGYQTEMRCVAPPHESGWYTLEISGNDQQFTTYYLRWQYDANVWLWLICGVVGFIALLLAICCAKCWATVWKFKDYRLMATKEYREMTGKSMYQSVKDLASAKDAEERRKTIQVLNMLKMKRKANQPKFSQKSSWGVAATKALQAKRAEQSTGWDALLLGGDKPAAGSASGGGCPPVSIVAPSPVVASFSLLLSPTLVRSLHHTAYTPPFLSALPSHYLLPRHSVPSTTFLSVSHPTQGAEAKDTPAAAGGSKPPPGAAWGAIMSMSKEGGGSQPSKAAASGWAKLAQAPKGGDKKGSEWQPLL